MYPNNLSTLGIYRKNLEPTDLESLPELSQNVKELLFYDSRMKIKDAQTD
jgi:hypothetical protein